MIGDLIPFIFDNPFETSYSHRIVTQSNHSIFDILHIQFPAKATIFYILEFFLNSPIVIISLYASFISIRKKDKYSMDKLFIAGIIVFTFLFAAAVALVYPISVAPQFSRHMTPIFTYSMLLLPYFFADTKKIKNNKKFILFIIVGILSVFMNWINTMYENVDNISLSSKSADFIPYFFNNGPSSPFLSASSTIFGINGAWTNTIGLALLLALLFFILKKK